jgi:hypothetical protein
LGPSLLRERDLLVREWPQRLRGRKAVYDSIHDARCVPGYVRVKMGSVCNFNGLKAVWGLPEQTDLGPPRSIVVSVEMRSACEYRVLGPRKPLLPIRRRTAFL